MASGDWQLRSCWACNAAHEHLKQGGLVQCYDCGHLYLDGVQLTTDTPQGEAMTDTPTPEAEREPTAEALDLAATIIEYREGARDNDATPGLAIALDAFAASRVQAVLARLTEPEVRERIAQAVIDTRRKGPCTAYDVADAALAAAREAVGRG